MTYDIALNYYLNYERLRKSFVNVLKSQHQKPRFLFLFEEDQFQNDRLFLNLYLQSTNMNLSLPAGIFKDIFMIENIRHYSGAYYDTGLFSLFSDLDEVKMPQDIRFNSKGLAADKLQNKTRLIRFNASPGRSFAKTAPFLKTDRPGILWLIYAYESMGANAGLTVFKHEDAVPETILPAVGLNRMPLPPLTDSTGRPMQGLAQFHLVEADSEVGLMLSFDNKYSGFQSFDLITPRLWFTPTEFSLEIDRKDSEIIHRLQDAKSKD